MIKDIGKQSRENIGAGQTADVLINCPTSIMVILVGNSQHTALPMAYSTNPAAVTFRLPNFFASGHTAKIPMPMGIPPMTEIIV